MPRFNVSGYDGRETEKLRLVPVLESDGLA
jgi:hypothetical protein